MNKYRKERLATATRKAERFTNRVTGLRKLLALESEITKQERLELESILANLVEQQMDALDKIEEIKAEQEWRLVGATTTKDLRHYQGSYTVTADEEGYYHWKVNGGTVDGLKGIGSFFMVRSEMKGQSKTRRVAKSKAINVFNNAVRTAGKNLRAIGS